MSEHCGLSSGQCVGGLAGAKNDAAADLCPFNTCPLHPRQAVSCESVPESVVISSLAARYRQLGRLSREPHARVTRGSACGLEDDGTNSWCYLGKLED